MMGDFAIISSVLGFIMLLIMFVIPYRLLKIREATNANSMYLKNIANIMRLAESQKGIKGGYLTGRKCVFCEKTHVPELSVFKNECPDCGFSYKPGNVIYRHGDYLQSKPKKAYDKLKSKNPNIEFIEQL